MVGFGFGPAFSTDVLATHGAVFGPDNPTSLPQSYVAPMGSRSYSAITSLIEWAGSQAAVKTGLGLDNGVFSLTTNPDLTQFDMPAALASSDSAAQAEGARVAAANLRAQAIAVGLEALGVSDSYLAFAPSYRTAGEWIGGHSGFLFNNANMSALLASVAGNRLRPETISAVAHLIDAYAAAIPVQVPDQTTAGQYTLGLYGYLRLEIALLVQTDTVAAANAALAVTTPQIISATQVYRDFAAFPSAGRFFPAPNFFATSSASLLIRADRAGDPGSNGSLISNDLYANGETGAIGFFPGNSDVVSVTVPSARAAENSASLGSGSVVATALNGFKGTTYFDYTVRHPSGETGTARVYVTFR